MEMVDPHTGKESDAWALSRRNPKGKERDVEENEDDSRDFGTRSIKPATSLRGRLGLEVSVHLCSTIPFTSVNLARLIASHSLPFPFIAKGSPLT